jgi:uncharacterized sulfatase
MATLNAQQNKLSAQQRYNVILVIADDLGVNDIEPYGNKIVRTPNLMRLSKESLLFTRAFASSPTCTPLGGKG